MSSHRSVSLLKICCITFITVELSIVDVPNCSIQCQSRRAEITEHTHTVTNQQKIFARGLKNIESTSTFVLKEKGQSCSSTPLQTPVFIGRINGSIVVSILFLDMQPIQTCLRSALYLKNCSWVILVSGNRMGVPNMPVKCLIKRKQRTLRQQLRSFTCIIINLILALMTLCHLYLLDFLSTV